MPAPLDVDRVDPQVSTHSDARLRRSVAATALVAGLATLLLAIALPLAPVNANQPVVTWPKDARSPQSTLLTLTAYQPLDLDVRFSCQTARLADQTEDGVVLATVVPDQPAAVGSGLLVTSELGRLVVQSSGKVLVNEPLPGDGCRYRISGRPDGLTISRDGTRLSSGGAAGGELPDVDALVTSVRAIPNAADGDLAVRIEVDDRFSTTPTLLKLFLLVGLGVALVVSIASVILLDRWRGHSAVPRTRLRLHLADGMVVAILVLWAFLAPMTDDDGYYSAMARNYPFEGYVGNYQQLFNHAFTPFTWFYVLLSKWQVVGLSPVVQRVPALVCGLVIWLLLRLFVGRVLPQGATRGTDRTAYLTTRRTGTIASAVLAVTFLIWFLPHGMGVRPEPIVAVCATGALVAIAAAIDRRSLTLAALAVGVASIGFATHTTGFVVLAPLVAALPALWRLVRVDLKWITLARAVVVVAPAALASVLPFADGSLNDFVQAQEIFLASQDSESWYTEYIRYYFLLSDIPMGNYAKRAAVLLSLVALIWFVILIVAAKARQLPVPMRLQLSGWSLGLAFLLLWLTPSKWTHHFGAISGLGTALLCLMLLVGPMLVRDLTGNRRLPGPVVTAVLSSLVLAMALAGHGPNDWPYSWMLGMPHVESPPRVWIFRFGQPLWWALALLIVAWIVAAVARRRATHWRPHAFVLATPVVVIVFIVANLGYLVGSFGLAANRTWDTWSLWASNLQDPLGSTCSTSRAIEVLDERSARPLPKLQSEARPGAGRVFRSGDGWPAGALPPKQAGPVDIWGSFGIPPGGGSPNQAVGEFTSPWYGLPATLRPGTGLSLLIAGRVGGGNSITVEYGRVVAGRMQVSESRKITREADSPAWRSFLLAEPGRPREGLPVGADAVRLVAVDGTTDGGGWLAVTAPTVARFVSLQRYIPEGSPVGVSWRIALLFPCLRQTRVQDGVTEPIRYAVSYRGGTPLRGMTGGPWQAGDRGGLFGKVTRTSAVFQPTARLRAFPEIENLQVFRYTPRLPADAYELTRHDRRIMGW